MSDIFTPERIAPLLQQAWSVRSSSKWTSSNPAAGQCSVTALVLQDIFGGDILYTLVNERPHFYNRISGCRYDLTKEQFGFPLAYDDIFSTREFVFSDCSPEQYFALKTSLEALFSGL